MTRPLSERRLRVLSRLGAVLPYLEANDTKAWSSQVPRPGHTAALEVALDALFDPAVKEDDQPGAELTGEDIDLLATLGKKLGTDEAGAYGALAGLGPRWYREFPVSLRDGLLALPEKRHGNTFELLGIDDADMWDECCLPLHQKYRRELGAGDISPEDIVRVLLRDPLACGQAVLEHRRAEVAAEKKGGR